MINVFGLARSMFQDRNTTSLAWFVQIQDRESLTVAEEAKWIRMTDADHTIHMIPHTWQDFGPEDALRCAPTESKSGLNVGDTEISGIIRDDGLSKDMIDSRQLQGGIVRRYLTDWRYPFGWGAAVLSGVMQDTWDIARVRHASMRWTIALDELRGRLNRRVGEVTSRTCMNELGVTLKGPNGDYRSRCTIDVSVAPWQQTGLSIDGVIGYDGREGLILGHPTKLSDPLYQEEDWFKHGWIEFETGPMTGYRYPVSESLYISGTQQVVQLSFPTQFSPDAADTVTLRTGCSHDFVDACKAKFNNVGDFRGDPFTPGTDDVIEAGSGAT